MFLGGAQATSWFERSKTSGFATRHAIFVSVCCAFCVQSAHRFKYVRVVSSTFLSYVDLCIQKSFCASKGAAGSGHALIMPVGHL
jgi:hypothetical protein